MDLQDSFGSPPLSYELNFIVIAAFVEEIFENKSDFPLYFSAFSQRWKVLPPTHSNYENH